MIYGKLENWITLVTPPMSSPNYLHQKEIIFESKILHPLLLIIINLDCPRESVSVCACVYVLLSQLRTPQSEVKLTYTIIDYKYQFSNQKRFNNVIKLILQCSNLSLVNVKHVMQMESAKPNILFIEISSIYICYYFV